MRPASLLVALALLFAPLAALADQYQWNDRDVAIKGAKILKKGRRVIHYCEPCKGGQREKPVAISTTTRVRKVKASQPYYEVVVDGRAVDLAYVFVEVAEGSNTFDNVAVALGLDAHGVSARLTE
jgi:hypothetical protein